MFHRERNPWFAIDLKIPKQHFCHPFYTSIHGSSATLSESVARIEKHKNEFKKICVS